MSKDMESLFDTEKMDTKKEEGELNQLEVVYDTEMGEWYSLQVHFGSEIAVEEQIKERAKLFNFEDRLSYVLVPKIIKISPTGKHLKKAVYQGYAFLQVKDIDNDIISSISSLPKVSRFIGDNLDKKKSDGKPIPLTKEDIMKVIEKFNKPIDTIYSISFEKGDTVLIKEGEFENFKGEVVSFDKEKRELELNINVFNRPTNLKGIDAKTVEVITE